ncbi:MAG: hypothetical protein IBX57_00860 [Gammaproteobacteria bacterium]|nr:hypothetical protein [Gammaproteobacteria bacterium]
MINAGVSILAFDGSQSYNASTKEWVNVKLKVNYPEGQDINVNPVSTGDYIFEPSGLIWRVQSVSKSGDIFIARLQVKYRTASEDIAPGFGITARGAITTPSVKNHLSDLHNGMVAEDAHRLMMTALPTIVQGRLMLDSDKVKLDRLTLETNGDLNLTGRRLFWNEHTDSAEIGFHNPSDGAETYMFFRTTDNGTEYFRWLHRDTSGSDSEWMSLKNGVLRIKGQVAYHSGNLPKYSWIYAGQNTQAGVQATYANFPIGTLVAYLEHRSNFHRSANSGSYYTSNYIRRFLEKVSSTGWVHR